MMKKLFVLAFCLLTGFAYAADVKTEKEILACLDTWKQALLQRDRAALDKLFSADMTYSHSNGRLENKAEAIEAVVNGPTRYNSIEMAETSVRAYGNTAVARAKVTINMTTDGKPTLVVLDVLHVFVKISGRWQLVARHSVRLNP
jgi:ketosteroid isomerase-like protein